MKSFNESDLEVVHHFHSCSIGQDSSRIAIPNCKGGWEM